MFTKGLGGDEGNQIRGGPFGLGLLLGGATFAFGRRCGCSRAEILAILGELAGHRALHRAWELLTKQREQLKLNA